jgi:hypothetical protein
MNAWKDARNSLPAEHEYVHFLVIGHSRFLLGTYENHSFRSRWGAYNEVRIKLWRKIDEAPHDPAPVRTSAELRVGPELPMPEG